MNVAEMLGASVEQALPRFEAHPRIHRTLALLHDVGLGYLTLGQSSPTLSGGEAQRIKLVAELAKVDTDAVRGEGAAPGDGRVVAAETPEEIAGAHGSHTGEALARFLGGRGFQNQEGAQIK